MEKIIDLKNKTLDFIYKYRFLIAIIIIVILTLFKIHGSSIGLWNTIFNTGVENNSLLIGKDRTIRSDEWAVTTPLIFSQESNNFKYFSNILRGGTSTDAFSLYGLPVFSILEMFRPFHLGYLLLGIEGGISFFWVARLVLLFLITFELGMVIFNKDKRVSVIGAFMVSLSPIIQWWFATNGTAELFIFGELALILLYKYLKDTDFKHRLLYLLGMMICAGGYVFIFYPAFQIPMFFVFLMLAIYIIAKNYKDTKITKKDIISIVAVALIFVALMTYFFVMSKDTINAVTNTVYPGKRIENGGGALRKYLTYIDNVFLPFKEIGIVNNAKNYVTHPGKEAVMFGLFPIGIIFAIASMIKNKKVDLFSILLLIPYVITGMFCFFEMPTWFAKITFLGYSTSQRAIIVLGYIDILLLLRSLSNISIKKENTDSKMKTPVKIALGILAGLVVSLVLVGLCRYFNPDYVGKLLGIILFVICSYLFSTLFLYNTKYGKCLFTIGIMGIMVIMGLTVNPISSGVNIIDESPIIKAAKEMNEKDSGIWLADALPFPCPNYLEMAGCPVINATNIYPNLDLWKSLDKENKYEDIYNRYAHVIMEIANEEDIKDKFKLVSKDTIKVFVTPEELKQMDIKYIFTIRVMEEFENENISFDLDYNENNYHIYKVNYK